eukprot:Stramenopile-MAST_4_protein_2840
MSQQAVPFNDYASQLEQSWEQYGLHSGGEGENETPVPTTPSVTDNQQYQDELESLQGKYVTQMELNTSLMDEVQHITKENNKHLSDIKEKERSLQAVLKAMDDMRRQNQQLRETVDKNASYESKARRNEQEIKIALTVSERKRESLESILTETKRELASVRERREIVEEQFNMVTKSQEKTVANLEDARRAQGDFPERLKELDAALKSKDEELAHLKASKEALVEEVNTLKKSLTTEVSNARRAQTEKTRMEMEATRLRELSKRQDAHEHEISSNIERLRERLHTAEQELDAAKVEVQGANRREQDAYTQRDAWGNRCQQTEVSLTKLRQTFDDHQRNATAARQTYLNDRIAYENQLQSVRTEMQGAAQDAHDKSMAYSKNLKEAQDDYREKLSRMDDQYVSLQNEYTTLNKVLEKVQKDKSMKMEEFEEERRIFRDRLHEVSEMRQVEAEVSHENETRHKVERARLVDEIARMEEELLSVVNAYNIELGVVKGHVETLRRHSLDVQEELNSVQTKNKTMAQRMKLFHEQLWKPVETYAERLKTGLQKVQDENTSLKSRLEDAKDQLSTSLLQRDDEHGQLIMAQDAIGRLQHQLAATRSRLESEVGQVEDRCRKAEGDARASAKLRSDMENRLHAKMEEVERANRQNTKLQLERQHLYDDLTKAQNNLARGINDEKEKVNSLAGENRLLEQTLQDTRRELALMQRDHKQTIQRVEALVSERASLHEQNTQLHSRLQAQEGQHIRNTKSLKSELAKLHDQMNRTRGLYDEVKHARDHLREDNGNLKAEMERIHRQQQSITQPKKH